MTLSSAHLFYAIKKRSGQGKVLTNCSQTLQREAGSSLEAALSTLKNFLSEQNMSPKQQDELSSAYLGTQSLPPPRRRRF